MTWQESTLKYIQRLKKKPEIDFRWNTEINI